MEACGVCHSDLSIADGDWKQFAAITKTPLVLGHEVAGRVVEAGSAVRELKIGDRVGVPWIYWSCGECEFCREGNENLCVKAEDYRLDRGRRLCGICKSSGQPRNKNS